MLKKMAPLDLNMDYFNYATGLTMTNNKFAKLFNMERREPENKLSANSYGYCSLNSSCN